MQQAGQVHPVTGEGIAHALWSAELVAETVKRGKSELFERRLREQFGSGLAAASAMMYASGSDHQAYEVMFQLGLALSLSVPGNDHRAH